MSEASERTSEAKCPQGAARERLLEPRYGCAEESFAFGGKPHEVRPEGPQGAARERILFRG